ncbi:hypothetical protein AC1031_013266 [Aphanomyces cochlioides]|nr:hypothetical protein AC1031_013266 [Aphanomyces cochlioides]
MSSGQAGEEQSKPTKLHSYWRSGCAWRVRTALTLKNIEYEYVVVNLLKGEQVSEEYVRVNPNGRVPTLEIDGHVLTQSDAIIQYLEETRPSPALLPEDAFTRAQVRIICAIIGGDIQPVQNLAVMKRATRHYPESEQMEQRLQWGREWVERGFDALEIELKKTAGKYCVGDTVTMADIYLVPQVYSANRFNVDMSTYPTIARIEEALAQLPAFQASHPSNQPDAF